MASALESSYANAKHDSKPLKKRQVSLQREIKNLVNAIAKLGHSAHLLEELVERERELSVIDAKLAFDAEPPTPVDLTELRSFFIERVANLPALLRTDIELAKAELQKHVSKITMTPEFADNGSYFVAKGDWDLVGNGENLARTRQLGDWRIRMVAGVRFELTTFGL